MAKQRVTHALSVAALALCALPIAPVSYADSYARIVRLSDVDGSVQIDRNTGNGFEKAIPNMPITQGVRLETGSTGRAEVEFENGSAIRLAEQSSVEFTQLSLRSNGDHVSEVRVNDGLVYVNYKRKGEDDFRISLANRALDLTKNVHFRLNIDRSNAEIAVFKGELNVQGPTETAKVKKNETFNLDLNDSARYELAKGITSYSSDDWDQERSQYLDQYASSQNSYNSPYAYGYSDLNRYGSFFDAPGYGMVWRPTAFGSNWDPYGNGYWSYYPGSGYVWVSSYPWGWAPYRYGQWIFLPAYGWAWRPGNWNHWNTGVTVINPPPAWRHPNPPPQGGGATVIVGQPPHRTPRTIQTEDLNPRHSGPGAQPSKGIVNDSVTRPGRNPRPVESVVTPQPGTTTTIAPSTNQPPQPSRQIDVERQTRTMRDPGRVDEQNMRGNRQAEQHNQPSPNLPTKQMSTPTPPPQRPPTVSVQPSRPSPPPARVETPRPAPPPAPAPRMERPSRMETPHAAPPPAAVRSEGRPSRTANPK